MACRSCYSAIPHRVPPPRARQDIEIIFMTDSVDEYTVQHLTEFEGKRLINASREGLKLEEGDKEKKRESSRNRDDRARRCGLDCVRAWFFMVLRLG